MPAIVGRDRELAAVASFLDAPPDGARILLLEGAAGIGKTTLWNECVRAARGRKFSVLSSSPSPTETRLAFAALGDLLGTSVNELVASLPSPQARALSLALHRADSEGPPPDPGTIGVAVLSALRALAAKERIAIAIDDVQWLDEPSAGALAYVLRRLRDEPVWFLLARRVDVAAELPLGLERQPYEDVQRISIGPLSLGALHSVITTRLSTVLRRPVLHQVHQTAAGNPFYALEIARALARSGQASPGEPLPIPRRLEALHEARLAALPAETLECLVVAAALHDPTIELVATAAAASDLMTTLAPAIAAHIVELSGDRLRFTHPLFASAVYARAREPLRHRVHGRLAELAPNIEERARHLALSQIPPNAEVAAIIDRAAGAAAARGAPATAAELATTAARFTPADLVTEMRRRTCDAADYYLVAGDGPRSRANAELIASEVGSGVEHARALFVLSFTDPRIERRVAFAEQALAEADGLDELAARIDHWLGFIHLVIGPLDRARAHAAKALARGGRISAAARAESMALLVLVDLLAGGPGDDELLAAALELERATGVSMLYSPSAVLMLRDTYADRLSEARDSFAAALPSALERGDEHMAAALFLHRAELECRAGDFRLALQFATDGYELSQQIGIPDRVAIEAYAQGLAHSYLGDVDAARRKSDEALAALPGLWAIQTHALLGSLELSLGNLGAADRHLRPLPAQLFEMGFGEAWHLQAVPAAIEVLVALGQTEDAERNLARYVERVSSAFGLGAAARCRGLIAAARGDLAAAFPAFDEALAAHDRAHAPFERARTLLALGRTQRRARRRRDARDTLERAAGLFDSLSARLWAERARAELARIGGRRGAGAELTPTERQIAELVAAGKKNREVAAALVVTERTVESALTLIYRKLEVRSRTELARKL